jgi:hypothetical protein
MRNFCLIAVVCVMISVFGCKKSTKDEVLPSGYITYLDSALISINPKFQYFKIDSLALTATKSRFLSSGTEFKMPSKCFTNKNGDTLKDGTVDLFIKEIITKRDMMVSGILPVSFGIPLETGRQFMAYAQDANGRVRLTKNYKMTYKPIQANPIVGTHSIMYAGQNKYATFTNWFGGINGATNSVTAANNVFTANTDSLSWLSIVKPIINTTNNLVDFKVNIVGPTPSNDLLQIRRYESYDNFKTVTISEGGITQNSYDAKALNAKPTHLVVYYVLDGKFYGGIALITPSQNAFYSVNVSEQNPLTFMDQVNLLP